MLSFLKTDVLYSQPGEMGQKSPSADSYIILSLFVSILVDRHVFSLFVLIFARAISTTHKPNPTPMAPWQ
jgi:hypothetical protein